MHVMQQNNLRFFDILDEKLKQNGWVRRPFCSTGLLIAIYDWRHHLAWVAIYDDSRRMPRLRNAVSD